VPGARYDLEENFIDLPANVTVEQVVDTILGDLARHAPPEEMLAALRSMGLSEPHAAVAFRCACRGQYLATGADSGFVPEPSRTTDPVGWASYQRCRREPALLAAIVAAQADEDDASDRAYEIDEEERAYIATLPPEAAEVTDQAILATARQRHLKVHFIVGKLLLDESKPQSMGFIVSRVVALIELGLLEGEGDPWFTTRSKVRLPPPRQPS
jgi:hypothetical protein